MLICDISVIHKYGKQSLDASLRSLGLFWQEMVVLMILEQQPDAKHALFCAMLQTDKGNVTRLLNSMETKGLIRRSVRTEDNRQKVNSLTASGLARLPALHDTMKRWEAACFSGLSEAQLKEYTRVSSHIVDNMMRINSETQKEETDEH